MPQALEIIQMYVGVSDLQRVHPVIKSSIQNWPPPQYGCPVDVH